MVRRGYCMIWLRSLSNAFLPSPWSEYPPVDKFTQKLILLDGFADVMVTDADVLGTSVVDVFLANGDSRGTVDLCGNRVGKWCDLHRIKGI